jgi:hypothetical protein
MVQVGRERIGAATEVEVMGKIESVTQKLGERVSMESGKRKKKRIRRLTARAISIL